MNLALYSETVTKQNKKQKNQLTDQLKLQPMYRPKHSLIHLVNMVQLYILIVLVPRLNKWDKKEKEKKNRK